ncbi:DUF2207 domain-containing protein [Microbacterium sp. BWT-B31]|uniref:DUF2207 domain-containing protein n=1 Tax=Microbacterium sp. BWT-B31 TaxID=3232072 RepID=UPI0035280FE5
MSHRLRPARLRRTRLLLSALAFAFVLVAGAVAPTAASAVQASARTGVDDFAFDSIEVEYWLVRGEDDRSNLYVTETIVASFPEIDQNHGIVRKLPRVLSGIDLGTRVEGVTDADGRAIPAWSTDTDDEWIYIHTAGDEFVHGEQTYVISYSMSDVVLRYQDTAADEFYWDVTGLDHAQPMGRVAAIVNVAGDAAGGLLDDHSFCYQGPHGSTERCGIDGPSASGLWPAPVREWAADVGVQDAVSEAVQFVTAAVGLGPRENVTVAIGFEQGTFAAASPAHASAWWQWVLPGIALLAGFGGLAFALVMRRLLRRNPDRSPVIAQYSPPARESVTMSAGILDLPGRALAAHAAELAVRGAIEIRASAGRARPDDFELVLIGRDGLGVDDRAAVGALFGYKARPGATTRLGTFAKQPPKRAVVYVRGIAKRVRQGGYREAAPRWPVRVVAAAGVAGFASALLTSFVFPEASVRDAVPAGLGHVVWVVAIVSGLFAAVGTPLLVKLPKTVLTAAGGECVTYLHGIRAYLRLAEEERLAAAQALHTADLVSSGRRSFGQAVGGPGADVVNLYERLLPYAVLFGMQREWLDVIRAAAPAGAATGDTPLFEAIRADSLTNASYAVGVLAAAPVARGSSGGAGEGADGWSSDGGSSGDGYSGGGGGDGGFGGE